MKVGSRIIAYTTSLPVSISSLRIVKTQEKGFRLQKTDRLDRRNTTGAPRAPVEYELRKL